VRSKGKRGKGEEQSEEREQYCMEAVEGTEGKCEEQRKEGIRKERGNR
jgi:hypothetical protein